MEQVAGGTFGKWLPRPSLLLLAYVVADAATYAYVALPGGAPWSNAQLLWILLDAWLVSLMLRGSDAALTWSLGLAVAMVGLTIGAEAFLQPQPGFAACVAFGTAQVAALLALSATGLPERRTPRWPAARRRVIKGLAWLVVLTPLPWSQSTMDARGCVDHEQGVAPAPLAGLHAAGGGTPGFSYESSGSSRCT
jgi:hypothetical protein